MSALFTPIKLRGLALPNRIMVAPMCQYSAVDGAANDWHFTHINSLALSGAAMFCIEATAVEPIGRITPGCLGLWNDATEAALKPIVASVRRHSKSAVAMQLAHAGRKASSARPWDGGQLIPQDAGGWQTPALIVFALAAIGIVGTFIVRSPGRTMLLTGLGLILGGALGNLIDRVRFGQVVDFLDFHAAGWHWPAFNLADSAITVGAVLLILEGFVHREGRARSTS